MNNKKRRLCTLLVAATAACCSMAQTQIVIDHASHGGAEVGYRYGFVDENEKWVIPPKYDNAEWHQQEGFAIVTLYRDGDRPQQKGVLNKYGEFTMPLSAEFNKINHEKKSGTLLVGKKADGRQLWGVYSFDGKELIPVRYSRLTFDDDEFLAELPSGQTARFDRQGCLVGAAE